MKRRIELLQMHFHIKGFWFLFRIFSECHKVIPPLPYFQGCIFDSCHIENVSMQCAGLEIYASLCASKGICVDWRNETNGACRKYSSVNQHHSLFTNSIVIEYSLTVFIKYVVFFNFVI